MVSPWCARPISSRWRTATANAPFTYTLLRLGTRELLQVQLAPIPQGNSVLYFVLAAVGIFALLVGALVRLRRPGDPSSLHFFWLTVAFFGVFTFSFAGRFDFLDWVFYWADATAGSSAAALAALHPRVPGAQRRVGPDARGRPSGAAPLPARAGDGGRAGLRGGTPRRELAPPPRRRWLERAEPAYLALCRRVLVLLGALAHVRYVTARRQFRWIVWGSLLGGVPFALGYAIPFALGATPSVRMELLAVPLGLIPLAFASAIVRYRLMDVEVIVKRGLVYVAAVSAVAAVYAVLLRLAGWVFAQGTPRLQHDRRRAGARGHRAAGAARSRT